MVVQIKTRRNKTKYKPQEKKGGTEGFKRENKAKQTNSMKIIWMRDKKYLST